MVIDEKDRKDDLFMVSDSKQNGREQWKEQFNHIIHRDNLIYINLLLANFCMPTLLKLKPSSLIQITKIYSEWEEMKKQLSQRIEQYQCSFQVLYENQTMASVLIFQKELMYSCVNCEDNYRFLLEQGYSLEGDKINSIFDMLKKKLYYYHHNRVGVEGIGSKEAELSSDRGSSPFEFPHEIGVILGYPIQDVIGFVENKGQNYLISGWWKVYGNVEQTMRLFQQFKRLRADSMQCISEGKKLPLKL